ncbi:MAG TPA: type II secretion system protein [Alphaproteobacteria bacterium]|nr:type II secretion system protein [Alphaproteobacteria bacterium]
MQRLRQNQHGYSLIEAAIVLGIAGLIIGAVFAAWGAVNSQNKLRRAQDEMTVIVNQIRSTYASRSTIDSASGSDFTNALVNSGLLPDTWVENISGTNKLANPYGGAAVVTPEATGSDSSVKDGMSIAFDNVGKGDCYKLVRNMLGAARTQGLYKIDGADIAANNTFTDIKNSVCTSTTTTFYFKLKTGS